MWRKGLFVVLMLVLGLASVHAQKRVRIRQHGNSNSVGSCVGSATYFVRTDGNDANTGTANTAGGAWRHIDYASDNASAGNVVCVQTGTYIETASLGVSGTSGSPITLVADGSVTTCGMTVSAKTYIRVLGFTMDPSTSGCTPNSNIVVITGTNTGLEFWDNTFQHTNNNVVLIDASDRCNACIFIGNTFQDVHLNGSCFNALTLTGDDSFASYNNFNSLCYLAIVPSGHRLRMVNNTFNNLLQEGGEGSFAHPDFFYIQGTNTFGYSNNLIEASYGIGTVTSTDNKVQHWQTQATPATDWNDNIHRFNVFYQLGAGYYSIYSNSTYGLVSRVRFYNDTVVSMEQAQSQSDPQFTAAGNLSSQFGALSASLFNNIYVNGWTEAARTSTAVSGWSANYAGATITSNYNLLYDTRGAVTSGLPDANPQVNVNPLFVNLGSDFSLQSGSGARGVGGALTTANGSGSGSTSLTVASGTGSVFVGSNASNLTQYGGALAPGDPIRVGTCNSTVSSISGDTITLASACTWSNGASVYYGDTSTIDLGAFPYKAGGYTLSATYSCSAGTCTITPSDSSLVRFAVCYNNGIPYAIDNTSPYTCSTPSGSFFARLYPRYASLIRWANATQ